MGQYLQFRSWLRDSSNGEKALATTAAAVVIGLTSWSLVPAADTADSAGSSALAGGPTTVGTGQAAAGTGGAGVNATTPGAPGSTAVNGGTGAPGSGVTGQATGGGAATGATGTTTLSGSSGASSKCGQLTSTDKGVSPTQIRVAAVTLNLAGAIGNSAVGVASPEQQQQMAKAMVDEVNARGGIACRKLVVTFFSSNPIDPSTSHQACLDIVQGNYFAAIDLGGMSYPPGAGDCVAQYKVPIFASYGPTPSEKRQYYPYLMSLSADPTVVQRNAIIGMSRRGWFTAGQGFKKLGILMDTCSPEVNNSTFAALAQVGIQKSAISIASVSCPTGGFASPGDMQSAVIQHFRDHVTNVIPIIGGGSFKEYTIAAQRQGFKPRYTTTDYDGMEITATGGTGPDTDNFDGTISVSNTRIGENTSGLSDPASRACMQIFKRHGVPPEWVMNPDPAHYYEGGNFCSTFLAFAAAVAHDPGLRRTGLVTGLGQLGRLPMAFTYQDAVFNQPGKVSGSDYWWVVQFSKSCTCWKVIDRTSHPNV